MAKISEGVLFVANEKIRYFHRGEKVNKGVFIRNMKRKVLAGFVLASVVFAGSAIAASRPEPPKDFDGKRPPKLSSMDRPPEPPKDANGRPMRPPMSGDRRLPPPPGAHSGDKRPPEMPRNFNK
ncbi:MAG: hypothetical protein IJU48_09265 [Synergistaceae bacterium]|nr:hypothetical protein [Synergistaceae bacterium]